MSSRCVASSGFRWGAEQVRRQQQRGPATVATGRTSPFPPSGLTTGWRFGGIPEWLPLGTCRVATPISGLGQEASAEAVSYEASRAGLLLLRPPYAPGASEKVSVGPLSCPWMYSAVQHRLSTFLCEACWLFDRIQLHTEKRDPLHWGEFALFPVDLKAQLAEVTEHQISVFA